MYVFIITVHIIVCIFLVLVVLLQSGRGTDLGAAFGGMSERLFGVEGPANILEKVTIWAALIFFITSFTIAYLARTHKTVYKPLPSQEQPIKRLPSK